MDRLAYHATYLSRMGLLPTDTRLVVPDAANYWPGAEVRIGEETFTVIRVGTITNTLYCRRKAAD